MRRSLFAIVVVLCAVPAMAADAAPSANEAVELQRQARVKMRFIEYELAVPLLERALKAELGRHQKAELLGDLGICHASLGETERARAAFEGAVTANQLLDLPVGTSPKIRQLFESVRSQGVKTTPAPVPIVVAPQQPTGLRVLPVDFFLGAVVVVGVAAGVIGGVLSSNAASEIQSGLHTRSTVDSLALWQKDFGIASVSAYALAGAAALSELAVVLFVDRRPEAPIAVSGGLLPTGGATAKVLFRF